MAEPPGSWDRLTASLSLFGLKEPFAVWAFLVVQAFVRDHPGDREQFAQIVADEVENETSGPSASRRIAMRLQQSELAIGGNESDPWGESSAQRLAQIQAWTGEQSAREYLERLQEWKRPEQ